jgi:hypothetical protein
LIKRGLETCQNQQALLECISSKISHRNIYLIFSPETLNITSFFFDHIELFLRNSNFTLHKSSDKYVFELADVFLNSSMDSIKLIIENVVIDPSPILFFPLFKFITNFNQLNRCLPNDDDMSWVKDLMTIFKESQQTKTLPESDQESFETIGEWFSWIVKNEKISALLKQWKSLKQKNSSYFGSLQSLLVLFGLFPFVIANEEACDDLLEIVRFSCNETNVSLLIILL